MKHRPGCPCDACAPLHRPCDIANCAEAATHVPKLTLGHNGKRLNMPPAFVGLLVCPAHRDKLGARQFAKTIPSLAAFEVMAVEFVALDSKVARQLARVKEPTS